MPKIPVFNQKSIGLLFVNKIGSEVTNPVKGGAINA